MMRLIALWHLWIVKWLTCDRVFDGWIEAWTDARRDVRELNLLRSVRVLGRLRETKAIPVLARTIKDFGATYMANSVCVAAARALGQIGDPGAIPILRDEAFGLLPSSYLVVEATVESLGKVGDQTVADTLAEEMLSTGEVSDAADAVFSTDFSSVRLGAVVKAMAMMKGIVPQNGDYSTIPLAQLLAGGPLPVEQRPGSAVEKCEDPTHDVRVAFDFERHCNEVFSDSMRLCPDAVGYRREQFLEEALNRASLAIMGRHGLTKLQASDVRERFLTAAEASM